MTAKRHGAALVRLGLAGGIVLVLAACTPGGQFDPTTIFANDVFDSKKPLQGQREPVFPNGVPGIENGVPPELVKGYQPPPDQSADTAAPAAPDGKKAAEAPAAATEAAKPRPKPRVARAPSQPQAQDPAFNQKPPTRISVGPKPTAPAPAPQGTDSSQSVSSQSAWPSPPSTAQQTSTSSQSVWPAPPPTGPAQQTTQPGQSIWPNPPPTH